MTYRSGRDGKKFSRAYRGGTGEFTASGRDPRHAKPQMHASAGYSPLSGVGLFKRDGSRIYSGGVLGAARDAAQGRGYNAGFSGAFRSSRPSGDLPWTGRTLREGNRGHLVTALQRTLCVMGYGGPFGNTDAVDRFGPKTAKAVRNFQLASGIWNDGIVGNNTTGAMRRWLEAHGINPRVASNTPCHPKRATKRSRRRRR